MHPTRAVPPRALVIIVQHEPRDPPNLLADHFASRGVPFAVFLMMSRKRRLEDDPEEEQKSAPEVGIESEPSHGNALTFAPDEEHSALLPSSVGELFWAIPPRAEKKELAWRPIPPPSGPNNTFKKQEHFAGEECSVAGVIVLGGYMSVNDNLPYFDPLYSLMRSCIDTNETAAKIRQRRAQVTGNDNSSDATATTKEDSEVSAVVPVRLVPLLGICLGSQLLAAAVGGGAEPAANIELGWIDIWAPEDSAAKDDEEVADRLLQVDWFGDKEAKAAAIRSGNVSDRDGSWTVMHTHGEQIRLPTDGPIACRLLRTNDYCTNQAFQVGDLPIIGIQSHPEIMEDKLRRYLAADWPDVNMTRAQWRVRNSEAIRGKKPPLSPAIQPVEDVLDESMLSQRLEQSQQQGTALAEAFISQLTL